MKKFFQLGLLCCGVLLSQAGFADDMYGYGDFNGGYGQPGNVVTSGSYDRGFVEQPCPQPEQPTGDCWCMYCKYEPCYNKCWRCIEEPRCHQVKRCRYVPKYYEVQRCRYVPQYYTETICRSEPEYYCDTVTTTCKRWVCDTKCSYKPRYYWKRVCNANVAPEAPASGCCPTGGCASGQCGLR